MRPASNAVEPRAVSEARHPHIYNMVPILSSVALCWSAFLPSAVHGRARFGRAVLWEFLALEVRASSQADQVRLAQPSVSYLSLKVRRVVPPLP